MCATSRAQRLGVARPGRATHTRSQHPTPTTQHHHHLTATTTTITMLRAQAAAACATTRRHGTRSSAAARPPSSSFTTTSRNPAAAPAPASRGARLVARFRQQGDNGADAQLQQQQKGGGRLVELAVAQQQEITKKYLPPGDEVASVLPNPGSPRANTVPDTLHPDLDGAPHDRDHLTVLQQHVEFFDFDHDGIIWPWDTARGFRDIGYNPLISALAPLFIHSGMSLPTQEGFPNPLLPIHIARIHKCKHGSDSGVYDNEGRFVPQKFEEIFTKFDRDNKGGLTFSEVWDMCQEQAVLFDGFGRLATLLEWTITFAGFKDKNGVLPREAIHKQFDGSLWREWAIKQGSSMKEKKGHGKHLQ